MSYQPPPYLPPSPYQAYYWGWPAYEQLLIPARRASLVMLILGALGLACGACAGSMVLTVPWDQLPAEMVQAVRELESELEAPTRTVLSVLAVAATAVSLLMIVLGLRVRLGGRAAIYTSLALTCLILLYALLNLAASLLQTLRSPATASRYLPGLGAAVLVSIILVVLLLWLLRAARNAGQLRALQQQHEAQYWQHAQAAYGYPTLPGSTSAAPATCPTAPGSFRPTQGHTPPQPPTPPPAGG